MADVSSLGPGTRMRFLSAGLLGLLEVFLPAEVARAQRTTNLRVDSANVVALVLSAIDHLPPDDAGDSARALARGSVRFDFPYVACRGRRRGYRDRGPAPVGTG
jgi:hypothetical protein